MKTRPTKRKTPISKSISKSLDETHKQLIESMDKLVDTRLNAFQQSVCGPRILLTNKLTADIESVKSGQQSLQAGQDVVLHRIDNVSANGNKGLESSLKDIYAKNAEIHDTLLLLKVSVDNLMTATEPARNKENMISAVKLYWATSGIGKVLKYKVSRTGLFILLVLIINTILHALDIKWDIMSIISRITG